MGIAIGFGISGLLIALVVSWRAAGSQQAGLAPVPPPLFSPPVQHAPQAAVPVVDHRGPTATPAITPQVQSPQSPISSGNTPPPLRREMDFVPVLAAATTPPPVRSREMLPAAVPIKVAAVPDVSGETLPSEKLDRSDYALPELIEYVERSVVRLNVQGEFGSAIGSGFVANADGAIVTNYHVIEGGKKAIAEFQDGTKADVEGVLAMDPDLDLAVIRVSARQTTLIPLDLSTELPRKGEAVAAFGAPKGLSFSASAGIISAIRTAKEMQMTTGTFLQTTAAISGGNSGGPLTNLKGQVVGVNSFSVADGENLNFAVSSLEVKGVLDKLGDKLVELTPENVPVKVAGPMGSAVDLAGTERGRLLLSQIREAAVTNLRFRLDPTRRVSSYISASAERMLEQRLKWKIVKRRDQIRTSTAMIVNVIQYEPADDDDNRQNELSLRTMIFIRDVDKDGVEILAKVWDEKESVARVSRGYLLSGNVSRSVQEGVNAYFTRLVNSYRAALRQFKD